MGIALWEKKMNKANKTLILILLLSIGLGCGYSKPKTSMPSIAQLTPAGVSAGSGQFQLVVKGTNFSANAVINFNGMAEATTVVNANKVETMIPASAIMQAGTVQVTVTNPGSGGIYGMVPLTSNSVDFTID